MKTTLAIVIIAASACAHGASAIQPGHKLIRPLAQPARPTTADTERLHEARGYTNPHKFREDAQADLAAEGRKLAKNLNLLKYPSLMAKESPHKTKQQLQEEIEASRTKIRVLNSATPNLPSKNPHPGKTPPPPAQ